MYMRANTSCVTHMSHGMAVRIGEGVWEHTLIVLFFGIPHTASTADVRHASSFQCTWRWPPWCTC